MKLSLILAGRLPRQDDTTPIPDSAGPLPHRRVGMVIQTHDVPGGSPVRVGMGNKPRA